MFFKKKEVKNNNFQIKICALLIHAAKIDENYTDKEKKLIRDFVADYTIEKKEIISQDGIFNILKKAEDYENNSNQILEFTKEVKKMELKLKMEILKTLWKIVLSDDKSGIYENNLMRRICGLLYIPDKLSGEIKSSILNGRNK